MHNAYCLANSVPVDVYEQMEPVRAEQSSPT